MNKSFCRLIIFQALVLMLAAGCGYHSPYYLAESGAVQSKKIYIEAWHNQTNEAGLETAIQRSLNKWCQQSKIINVVWEKDRADLVLSGEIIAISLPGQSFNQFDRAREVNAALSVRYSLNDLQNQKLIIDEPGLTLEESYLIESESAKTRSNRKKALATINDKLAEKIYLRILTGLSSQPTAK